MEKESAHMTDEEIVSRILGLPLERIEYLKEHHGLVCTEPEFDNWFVENAELVLLEKKQYFNEIMGVPTPTSSDLAVSVPVSYAN